MGSRSRARSDASSGDASPDPPDLADRDRWESLIRSLKPKAMLVVIESTMSARLRRHCSAEDVWQETLERAWRSRARHEWRGPAAFRAWLFEIARNRIRELGRNLVTEKRGGGHALLRFSEVGPGSSASTPAVPVESQTPSRILKRGEKQEITRKALSKLPPDLQEIVRMHLVEGLTMQAIADRLGIDVSAAWRRFRKGSEALARILPSWAGDPSTGAS